MDFESSGCAFEPRRGRLIFNMRNSHLAALLLERLEHLSADSVWAHRASGVRGSLLRMLEQLEDSQEVESPEMQRLISYGFQILESVARERRILFHRGVAWEERPGDRDDTAKIAAYSSVV